ncbi:hypothetical protein G9A89_014561 [Geosiphon pyriformis]|nr:hypothetical protein G9A89_014561 [Geosiphon pyriformis]
MSNHNKVDLSPLEHSPRPVLKSKSISMPTQSALPSVKLEKEEQPSDRDQPLDQPTILATTEDVLPTNTLGTQQHLQTQNSQLEQQQPKTPSAAKKLVNKLTTFTPNRTKNKGTDRKLIVEPAYCNRNSSGTGKKDSQQSDVRPVKSIDSLAKPKKKKRSPNITEGMSRAEIFAANVASAVDAAEAELDEDEDFIYNRDRGHTRTPSLTSLNSVNQPTSAQLSYPHMPPEHMYGYPGNQYQFPANLYSAMPNPRRVPFHTISNYHRPPFYGNYPQFYNGGNTSGSETDDASIQPNQKGSSSPTLLPHHKPTGVMRASLPDMSQYSKGYPNYGTTSYYYNDPFYHDWYSGDDERLPLFAKWRPPYEDRRRSYLLQKGYQLTVRGSCAILNLSPKINSLVSVLFDELRVRMVLPKVVEMIRMQEARNLVRYLKTLSSEV